MLNIEIKQLCHVRESAPQSFAWKGVYEASLMKRMKRHTLSFAMSVLIV